MHPYRSPETKPTMKLPRLKARIRGLCRRIVIPTQIIALLTLMGCWMNICSAENGRIAKDHFEQDSIVIEQNNKRHFEDWQGAINKREEALNIREQRIQETILLNRCR